ncbi:hypothetical protein [Methylotuvimicrobium sp. KM2]|uniref:serine/threonine protein kinase n=1 Tax=Methylotuvimicrobium sp. KM2 TaxID=3133976 RepID=UPI003101B1B9
MTNSLQTEYDSALQRDIVKFHNNGEDYRCVAQLNDRYHLTGVLAAGGFGVIYQAEDRRLFNKKVLIKANRYNRRYLRIPNNKAVDKEVEKQRERLEHERRMLLQAGQRDIAQAPLLLDEIHDLGLDLYGPHQADDGQTHYYAKNDLWRKEPFLVLNYINGLPMDAVLNTQDRSDDSLKAAFFRNQLFFVKSFIIQTGLILERFHQERKTPAGDRLAFIYQDLKPANVIFTREKNFMLIDFGSFALRINGQTDPGFARTGTLGYQPPEFSPNFPADKIDARADVFTLGATVYHMLTRQAPRADAQDQSVFDTDLLNKLPNDWRNWFLKATHIDLSQRFVSMQEAVGLAYHLPVSKGS